MSAPVLLYEHAGSKNHGCEAIGHTLVKLVSPAAYEGKAFLLSAYPEEDRAYTPGALEKKGAVTILGERHLEDHFFAHVAEYARQKMTGSRRGYLTYRMKEGVRALTEAAARSGEQAVAVAIGGDNYCYPELVPDLTEAHALMREKGFRTVLYGCSVEGAGSYAEDLRMYDRIVARESITYETLLETGVAEERLALLPDPAFALPVNERAALPEWLVPGKTVGLNLSPMAAALEGEKGAAVESFRALIRHILETSDLQIALIPHVVKANGDDRETLKTLYQGYEDNPRVILVPDADCTTLKRYISACALFVGARTHATIAAYSTCVPTLVIGYSVKSRGIAKDIFGGEENFVLPVQEIRDATVLLKEYDALFRDREKVEGYLKEKMPPYIEKSACNQARDMIFYSP